MRPAWRGVRSAGQGLRASVGRAPQASGRGSRRAHRREAPCFARETLRVKLQPAGKVKPCEFTTVGVRKTMPSIQIRAQKSGGCHQASTAAMFNVRVLPRASLRRLQRAVG